MYDTQVIIVGAGPTGLTLGIELARRSIAFRLIDAAEGPLSGSRGKGIQPRTLEVFEDLGVIGPILKAGTPYPRLRVHLGPVALRLGRMGGLKEASEHVRSGRRSDWLCVGRLLIPSPRSSLISRSKD